MRIANSLSSEDCHQGTLRFCATHISFAGLEGQAVSGQRAPMCRGPDLVISIGAWGIRHRYLQNITIPAAFVTKSVGDALKGLIKPTGRDKDPHAMVSMDWVDILPRSEVVRHDLPLDHHSSPDVRCRRLFVSAGQAALTTLDCLYLCPLVNRPLRLCNVCNNETNTILRTTFCARKVMHMPAAALQC